MALLAAGAARACSHFRVGGPVAAPGPYGAQEVTRGGDTGDCRNGPFQATMPQKVNRHDAASAADMPNMLGLSDACCGCYCG